jgi:uncharacterized protein
MQPLLQDVILAANPWLERPGVFAAATAHRVPDPFQERRLRGMEDWPLPGKAHVIIGARQVGKSTLLWHWFRDRDLPPLFINAEEPAIRAWCSSPTLVLADIRGLIHPGTPVFIDEAQHLDDAGLLLKRLLDGGLPNPLFVTSSSSFHLQAWTREDLAGRATRHVLHPISLAEFAADEAEQPPLLAGRARRRTALRQAVHGSYPEVWFSADPHRVLAQLVEAFVVRDASDLFKIHHLGAFRTLLGLLAGQVGNLVNTSEWANICDISRGTVASYLDILQESHVAHMVRPFAGGKRAELTSRPKLYLCDNGIRNVLARQLTPFDERIDRGILLENWVGAELRKHLDPLHPMDELRYWRTSGGAEVDFVLTRPDGIVGIEVKATALKSPRLTRSSRSFIEAYAPVRFVVINLGYEGTERLDDTTISWVGPEWLAAPDGQE